MVQPVPDSGFYRVFADFCGFLNIGFFTKPKPDFFWVTGFTGSTAGPGRVSKHWLYITDDLLACSLTTCMDVATLSPTVS